MDENGEIMRKLFLASLETLLGWGLLVERVVF